MFQLDEQFLKDVGLDQLPEEQKRPFLEHIYSQLELQVGTRLSEGLNDAQLSEFESFIDRDEQKVMSWLQTNTPNYVDDAVFQQLKNGAPEGTAEVAILSEYASLKWLGMNRPDYKSVVQEVLDSIKKEIIGNRDTILNAG